MELEENPLIECACGCGQLKPKYIIEGNRIRKDRPTKYIKGHSNKDEKNRLKISLRQLGENNSFYGKEHTEETKKLIGKKSQKTFVERYGEEKAKKLSEKLSIDKKRQWENPESKYNISIKGKTYEEIMGKEKADELKKLRGISSRKINLGKTLSEETKLKKSKAMIKKWREKEYREKVLKLQAQGRYKKPTSYEKKVSELLVEYNLPFIYTGNGTFFIGTKNPDFVNKEKRIAIEVYYSYFKKKVFGSCEKYEKQRIEYFAKYGYNTIFIRDNEINSKNWKEICLNKLKDDI